LPRGKHVREDTSRPVLSKQNYDSYESPSLFPLIHPFDIFDESPLRLTLANHTLPEGESLWGGFFPASPLRSSSHAGSKPAAERAL
jgi:hypothetical protein